MKYLQGIASVLLAMFLLTVVAKAQENKTELNLMPWPAKITLTGGEYRLNQNFTVEITGNPANRLYHAASRMLRRLSGRTGLFFLQDYISRDSVVKNPGMIIHADNPGKVKLYEDESYRLEVTATQILLTANTDIGALRGIRTFLQLLKADSSGYYFPTVNIVDYPRFPWRGLMIDACRHFMPINVIKRNLGGMAAVKLNVLHWHLSDDQGFRVECKTFPRLTGMGSDGLFYTQAQIRDIIKYANDRGIRVVPEFDLPGHSTSWFVGYPQYASLPTGQAGAPGPYSIERKWGIFDPTFNPTLKKTYIFLDKFFKEMSNLFPDEYVHIGGDENNGKQWDANPEIREFMKTHNIPDNRSLQIYFENRLIRILKKYHKKAMGWEEILNIDLAKSAIIQSWRGKKSLEQSVSQGHAVILSNGYYVNNYFPTSVFYLNDPIPDSTRLTAEQKKLIMGGEACMWSEFVTSENVDSRIWPNTAAIAERLWSPRNVRDVKEMYNRLDAISLELEGLGLTQKKNQAMMIRRLANGNDVTPLTNLINVVAPVKIYSRVKARVYTSYSPLTRVVDAAVPDPEVARNFTLIVDKLLEEKDLDKNTLDLVERDLLLWKKNDSKLESLIRKSPILKEIEPLSKNLSAIASIGLDALNCIANKTKVSSGWVNTRLFEIEKSAEPGGEVKLMIVSPIERLVNRAGEKR